MPRCSRCEHDSPELSLALQSVAARSMPFDTNQPVIVVHQDFLSLVTQGNPVVAGETVHFYMTGLGDVQPRPATGRTSVTLPVARQVPFCSLVSVFPQSETIAPVHLETAPLAVKPASRNVDRVAHHRRPKGKKATCLAQLFPSGDNPTRVGERDGACTSLMRNAAGHPAPKTSALSEVIPSASHNAAHWLSARRARGVPHRTRPASRCRRASARHPL